MQATTASVGNLLNQTRRILAAPEPWPPERVALLLDDLDRAIAHRLTTYPLGFVRVAAVGACLYVIDGRRRLRIIDLLLAELRAARVGHHRASRPGDQPEILRVVAAFCDDRFADLDPEHHCKAVAHWIDFIENRVLIVVLHSSSIQLAA